MSKTITYGINRLKKLISEFYLHHKTNTPERNFQLMKDIFFFKNNKISLKETADPSSVTIDETRCSKRHVVIGTLTTESILYRARKIAEIPSPLNISDFWEPPKERSKRGRLNSLGQQFLYISDSREAACDEIKLKRDDLYITTIYESVDQLNMVEIGFKDNAFLNKPDRLLKDFVDKIFCTPDEYIYEISSMVAHNFFALHQDGWCYPSIASRNYARNVCLKINSKTKLKIIGAFAFKYKENGDELFCAFDFGSNPNSIATIFGNGAIKEWERVSSLIIPRPKKCELLKPLPDFDYQIIS